ncbi:MAG: ribonuclease [Acidobacteriota bacterium]|jgi:ribonuclease G|nr:ribonuclease [Acidobacteriota bacterium]
MSKELIVSVNGREKKIAIIENERVTEFYIERGEENQGIVGNIYKGRVMRVLPGMQSAFVDIGLERDAFLYVSDFFDEEEEFERIVIDKSKKADVDEATRAAQEHIEMARLERERHMEVTQERAEPLLDAEPAEIASAIAEEEADEAPEVVTSPETPAQILEAKESEGGAGRKRGRRGRRRGKGAEGQTGDASTEQSATGAAASSYMVEDVLTPFVADSASFQRVVDEDESAAENGAMFKDARLQERIFDQIHAVEFDMEDVPATEVGSLLGAESSMQGSFQRVDDSDITSANESREPAFVQETVAAHVGAFIDEIKEETVGAQTFERVSDDEGGAEEEAKGKRGKRAATTATKRGAKKESTVEEAPKAKRAGSKAATKSSAKKSTASKKSASKKGGSARRKATSESEEGETDIAVLESEAERAQSTDLVATEAADGEHFEAGSGEGGDYEDAEASISSGRSRSELATRRGGRRRRRPVGKPQEGEGDERTNGKDEESEAVAEVEEKVVSKPAETTPPPPPPPRDSSRRDRPERAPQARTERPSQARPERNARDDRPGSNGGRNQRERSSSGGGSGSGGGRRDRHQPTITDLLREGQEVLVQIAKEPIAKKGARITSHIALPGRFLVYMPTVEHVGVSRKIESDSERARLRKLIQIIRTEEDVPSGGFIVRTAGVGISEEDLRDDARYLVRTWLDIRRSAEKMKAPAMAHRDLDLVQRLLRDQLSDEFTAIRVDSEDEYLRIVEFINRIQPRMVKRVKLYTRDAPILEAFGVQAEIDKAIKPRVWLKSGGYLVINQTEALVAIDVNTGKFVGRGGTRLEDTITRTNLEAVDEIVRQIRLRDLGGIIVLDLIDMEDRRNRNRVMQGLQEALQGDKSPTKVLSFNDFGLVIMTRKRVKQSLERTLCAPCSYCQGAGLIKSPQTICYEILDEARRLGKGLSDAGVKQTTLRINPEVARAMRTTERDVLTEIEDYLGTVDITSDQQIHQEQFDFAFI